MATEFEMIEHARIVLQKIAKGIDPLTGESIEEESFLNHPRIIRCFYFVDEVLQNLLHGAYTATKKSGFMITPEEKSRVKFPEGNIGINDFAKSINAVTDVSFCKRITGVEITKGLKRAGVLSEISVGENKTRTVTNARSSSYGFEMERRDFNGVDYEMVVMNEQGKRYILDSLEELLKAE